MDVRSQTAGLFHTARWLEMIEGDAPIVLIAPHGGKAGPAAFAKLHPKVNDLETAAITRELARRLNAAALINTGMDRNRLDCNRVPQLAASAPWMLAMIADLIEAAVARHGRVTVLLIHGWNIIEPRVDFGLGLHDAGGKLIPPAGAHISASDAFIHGPVADLAMLLQSNGIIATYGLRYPGGGVQNLLQAFTGRHRNSHLTALRQLAEFAQHGRIEALQLELSVALRLPGPLRNHALDAIERVFSRQEIKARQDIVADIPTIVRRQLPVEARTRAVSTPAYPVRVGVEFYDAVARVGGMVSFDFGPKAAGGRIMLLFDREKVALFTAEGKARARRGAIGLGPLHLQITPAGKLAFTGPAVIVNDSSAYLSVERALASGQLDGSMRVNATLELNLVSTGFDDFATAIEKALDQLHRRTPDKADCGRIAAYGRLQGEVTIDGGIRKINAAVRAGIAFSGLGPQKFETRRMLWAYLEPDTGGEPFALEARAIALNSLDHVRGAQVLYRGEWQEWKLERIVLEAPRPEQPPDRIEARMVSGPGSARTLSGRCETSMTLSRPGAGNVRVHTSLGFASYKIDGASGVGMFEYSRPAVPLTEREELEDDAE
jgi:hypothetical protein